jgi:hypothetical protein
MALSVFFTDKITNVVPPDSVDSLTKLILVNVIYFKGSWDNQFEKKHTKKMPFKISKVSVLPCHRWFLVPVLILALKHTRSFTSGT